MNALAPVAFTEHMISPLALLAPFVNQVEVTYVKNPLLVVLIPTIPIRLFCL